jgi:hypothetical protein
MNAHPLERDEVITVRWEYYEPDYRVDFWHQISPPEGSAAETMGYKQDSFRITGAKDVHEVLDWAEKNANDRTFVVWGAYKTPEGHGIVRVHGLDPTHNQVGGVAPEEQ